VISTRNAGHKAARLARRIRAPQLKLGLHMGVRIGALRAALLVALAVVPFAGARAPADQQVTVDRATKTVGT
jgi:hypothetical protein